MCAGLGFPAVAATMNVYRCTHMPPLPPAGAGNAISYLVAHMPFVPLDQLTPCAVDWLCPGRLACGHLHIVDGDPGLGKSLVLLDLAARLTRGRPWPDGALGHEA